MRRRATLTSLTAIAAALAVLAPSAPANAEPPRKMVGDYASVSTTILQPIRSEECTDTVSLKLAVNMQGIGTELEGQGFYSSYPKGAPVYTMLNWRGDVRVTGPDNFYFSDYMSMSYPTSEGSFDVSFCPDDFGTSKVAPGNYSVTATVRAYNYTYGGPICSATEPCNGYDNLYEKVMTSTFAVDFSQECHAARAEVPVLTTALKKARKALKRAKAKHKPASVIKKKKRAVTRAKAQLVKARSNVSGLC